MSYQIEKGENLALALGRVAAEEMDSALANLNRASDGASVHDVRKSLKRLRALLRSLRVAFPRLYQRENRRLAGAARKLSPLRDVHVQLRTLGRLRASRNAAVLEVRCRLLQRQSRFKRQTPALRAAVRQILRHSQGLVADWPLRRATPDRVAAGLKKIYRQGRQRLDCARRRPTPENLHEWRKKVKALGYGLQLIETLDPKRFGRASKRCDDLGDCLGDDHDLFMVLEALRRAHDAAPSADYSALAGRIAARREKLARRALKLGRRLYDAKPKDFEKRLDKLLTRAAKLKP